MKKFLFALITLLAVSGVSFAQKAVIKTPNVQCEVCKTRIDNQLKRAYGIGYVKADYRKHTVTVKWYPNRTNIENIKTELANMGYTADDVTADDAYFSLPKTCQHLPVQKVEPVTDTL